MARTITATAAGLLALTLTACAGAAPATGPVPGLSAQAPAPGPATAPVASADDVADAVARTYWATDTATDTTPTDAARRTTRWLSPTYAAIVTQTLPGGAGADWIELTERQGHMTVTVDSPDDIAGDLPADAATSATRVRIVTLTPTGPNGWIGKRQYLVATFTLIRNDADPWLVNGITVDQPLAGIPEGDVQDFG